MASSVTFTGPGNEDPDQAIQRIIIRSTPQPEDMLAAANLGIRFIVSRTQQGRDVNGAEFAPYSIPYGKHRERSGRNISPVDLTFSGRMLAGLSPEVISDSQFAITERDADAAAYGRAINEGTGKGGVVRRWFDTSSEELHDMAADLGESIYTRLRNR